MQQIRNLLLVIRKAIRRHAKVASGIVIFEATIALATGRKRQVIIPELLVDRHSGALATFVTTAGAQRDPVWVITLPAPFPT